MSALGDPGHVIQLTGQSLSMADVVLISRGDETGEFPRVELHPKTRKHMVRMRLAFEEFLRHNVVYGGNTGCGARRNIVIPMNDLLRYQRKYIMTHAVGTGKPLEQEIVRAMMLLRVNSFAVGNSAVTVKMCDLLLELLNRNIIPVVPEFGSVGASGDLVPLAHIGTVLIGLPGAQVLYQGETREAVDVFEEIEALAPIELQTKEAMGLTNGSTFILSMAVLAAHDAQGMLALANLDVALHMEAIRGERNAFDSRIHKARRQRGQIAVAKSVRGLLKGSKRITKRAQGVKFPLEKITLLKNGKPGPRVQDAYSARATPQAHGAVADTINELIRVVTAEINASTDNPLIFETKSGSFSVLSGANFHGDPLAIPLDALAIALAKLGSIVERRLYRLLDPGFNSGLPENLSGEAEDDTGFMILQYSQASRVMANQGLAAGHSVLNVPTSMGQEDYVSNGANSGWVVRKVLGNLRSILAMGLLADCQAVDLGAKYLGEKLSQLGEGTQLGYNLIREHVSMMKADRYLHPDIQAVRRLIVDGSLAFEIRDL